MMINPDEDDIALDDGPRLTLIEHLDEFRTRIIKSLASLVLGMVIAFIFSATLLDWLIKPCLPFIKETYFTSPLQPFNIRLKVSFFAGIILASPVILYQVWRFIKPALTLKERRVIRGLFAFALILFLSGVALAYYFIVPIGVDVLLHYATPSMKPLISTAEMVDFVVLFLLAMGIVFEVPIIMMGLAKVGLIDYRMLNQNRKYAVFGVVVIATAVTPGSEVLTSLILAVPLYFLFELSVVIVRFMERRKPANYD